MKILLTGASGRIGKSVAEQLHNSTTAEMLCLASPRSPAADGLVPMDLSDSEAVEKCFREFRPDRVVHLASIALGQSGGGARHGLETDSFIVQTLARLSDRYNAQRIVYASSSAVYGDRYRQPVREDGELDPQNDYARSKIRAEESLRGETLQSASLESVVLRIFNVYGRRFPDSLVVKLANSSPAEPVPIAGLDSFVRDYVHIDDVVDAIRRALSADVDRHSVFNIGSGTPVTNRHLIEYLSRFRPVHYSIVGDRSSYSCSDISAAEDRLSFRPIRSASSLLP